MSQWIKLHTHILHDARIGKLSWKERGIWLMLLVLAGELEDRDAAGHLTGRLDTLEEVAWHLHTRPERIQPTIERLIQLGLLHQDGHGVLFIADFAADQAADTPAERMQRYRQRTRALAQPSPGRDAGAMPPLPARDADVTHPLRPRDAGVTAPLRAVAESEQNRIRTEPEQQQHRTAPEPRAAVAAVDNSGDISVVAVDKAATARDSAPDEGDAAGDKVPEDGDARGDSRVWRPAGAQKPPAEVDGPRRPAPAVEHIPATDYTARAVAQSAYAAQAAVDAVWIAAEAAYEAQAAAEAAHNARAAPSDAAVAATSTADDAPPDGATQVLARLHDLAAAWDAQRAQARAQLIALGVEPATAAQLAHDYHPERIQAWCAYARRQTGLNNPAGYVVQRIVRGLPPPSEPASPSKRWYTDDEYARFFTA